MRRIGRTMPTLEDLAAYFEVDRDTVAARLKERPDLFAALQGGRSVRGRSLVKRLHQMATGYWRCAVGEKECNAPLTGPKGLCPIHGEEDPDHLRRFEKPNIIAAIWVTKNQLSWADRSILESKYGGDPRKIPDDVLLKAAREALIYAGGDAPPEPAQQDEDDPESDDDGDRETRDEKRVRRAADPH